MFPLSGDKLSFLKIADYWSRESRASQNELLAQLEAAWWLGEITGNSALNRLQFLKKMFESRREPHMQWVVFASPNDAGPPSEIPLPNGEIIVRPKIFVPVETDGWTENSCSHAFEALAELPSQQYFPLFSYSICFIDLTHEEFFRWARTRGFDLPGFWKGSSPDDAKIGSKLKVQEPPKTSRQVSRAEASEIYKRYRDEHDGIPTRDEEEAYMKSRGVGRNWVRQERLMFPRRKRGEKITKAK
jgi:hypothetical protein